MALGDNKARELAAPMGEEAVKTYSVYDGANRLIEFYVAITNAENNTICHVTKYAYDGVTNRVQKTKEDFATWNSSWDI